MKTNTEKRLWIEKSLSHKDIAQDEPFVSLMMSLASSDKNLDPVIKDINSYRSSQMGIQQAHKKELSMRVKVWSNPQCITFTTRYPLNRNTLEYKFGSFINTLSKKTYKNAYKRKRNRIKHHSFLDGGDGYTDLHIHSTIDIPEGRDINKFKALIRECWWNTGQVYFDKKPYYSDADIDAIAGYATRFESKSVGKGISIHDCFIP